MDKRKPKLEKVACFFEQGNGNWGFLFFENEKISNNDLFIYNKGVLWKLTKPKEEKRK